MGLRRIDLNLLVAFDAVMDGRSVTKAAGRLFVGQSAMSATRARIRDLFDDPVLLREGRQLVPTPVARRWLARAWRLPARNPVQCPFRLRG